MPLLLIIEVVLAFGFMIFIHEGGHYLACRLSGVDVDEFALGFGPTIAKRKWGKTLYSLRSIPLGGFCKPRGGDLSGETVEKMYEKPAEKGEFLFASWWKRILIFLAGPGMNFVSAICLVAFLYFFNGQKVLVEKPLLGFVPPGSLAEKAGLKKGDLIVKVNDREVANFNEADDLLPDYGKSCLVTVKRGSKTFQTKIERPVKPLSEWAISGNGFQKFLAGLGFGPDAPAEVSWGLITFTPTIAGNVELGTPARNAGLQDGDEITAINGHKVSEWSEMTYFLRSAKDDPVQVEFLRDKKTHTIAIHRVFNGTNKAIGISPVIPKDLKIKKFTLFQAFGEATQLTVRHTGQLMSGIGMLFTGKVSLKDNVSGPVTILRLFYKNASKGLEDLLLLVAGISLMLFIMNLLPIPLVDGGQIVLCLIEGIKRGPVSIKIQDAYQKVGIVMILGLFGLAFFNDFKNIFLEVHNHIR